MNLTLLRELCSELGFARMGICSADPFGRGARALRQWLSNDHHGEMGYMATHDRADPQTVLPGAKTIVVVALPYARPDPEVPPLVGRVAAYARGDDYHRVFKEKLQRLAERVQEHSDGEVRARACVDSAPILEREAAERAGVGFIGKSTMAIAPGLGSDVLLGELVLDIALPPTAPEHTRCGSCRACLDACPTGAFVDAFTLDARRCISYLTIEYRGWIPAELRPLIGNWVFGCDICQQVCPFNASTKPRPIVPELTPRAELPPLTELLSLGAAAHRRLVAGSAMRRAPRWQLQRNAAVALGNSACGEAIGPLETALRGSRYPIVRGHAAWALGELGANIDGLEDEDPRVNAEIQAARVRRSSS